MRSCLNPPSPVHDRRRQEQLSGGALYVYMCVCVYVYIYVTRSRETVRLCLNPPSPVLLPGDAKSSSLAVRAAMVQYMYTYSRRRGHLLARALQIRAVLSTHIHTEQGSRPTHPDLGFSLRKRPTHSFEFGSGFSLRKRPTHSFIYIGIYINTKRTRERPHKRETVHSYSTHSASCYLPAFSLRHLNGSS